MVIIMTALESEYEICNALLKEKKEYQDFGIKYTKGFFRKTLIYSVLGGVGKTNTSFSLGVILAIVKEMPQFVLFSGIAGGFKKAKLSEVYFCKNTYYGDFDLSADAAFNYGDHIDFKPPLQSKLNNSGLKEAVVVTSDSFIHGPFNAQNIISLLKVKESTILFDMESCALAHICHNLNINFGIIRAVSDLVISKNQQAQYDEAKTLISEKLKESLKRVLEANL